MSYKRAKQKFEAEGIREGFGEKLDVGRENTWRHRQGSEQGQPRTQTTTAESSQDSPSSEGLSKQGWQEGGVSL